MSGLPPPSCFRAVTTISCSHRRCSLSISALPKLDVSEAVPNPDCMEESVGSKVRIDARQLYAFTQSNSICTAKLRTRASMASNVMQSGMKNELAIWVGQKYMP